MNATLTIDWTRVTMVNEFDVEATVTGPRCGSCQARHANVDAIKACYLAAEAMRLQGGAEIHAEGAMVRALEYMDYPCYCGRGDGGVCC